MNKLSIFAAVLLATANRLPAPVVEASPQAADDRVGLSFFELGSNGKMHEASRTIFPDR
jgi:hypothetical protein